MGQILNTLGLHAYWPGLLHILVHAHYPLIHR